MKRINPNLVTSLRLFICTPLVCFFLMRGYYISAAMTWGFGEFTDWLDGFIARRTCQVSSLGKIFDPMCDSIFHMVIWLTFLAIGWVPLFFVIFFFVRDIVVANIRICLASHKTDLSAKMSGKVKAVSQGLAQISLILIHHFFSHSDEFEYIQLAIVSLAATVTLYSLLNYGMNFRRVVKEKGSVLG